MSVKSTETKLFLQLDPKKQQRILEAAIQEFATKGYTPASMNVVVDEAGISKGALFKYFRDKKGLFGYVYRMALNQVKNYLRGVRDESQDLNFFDRLELVMRRGVRFIGRYPLLARIYYRMIYTGDSPYRNQILQELHGESLKFIQSLVKAGIERGEVREDVNSQVAAFTLECVMDRFLQAHHLEFLDPALKLYEGTPEESERWIREVVDLLKKGMACRSSPANKRKDHEKG